MPAMKDLVPSIGSSTQTYSASVRSLPNSSPMMPWSGKLLPDQGAHGGLGGAVGGGHRIEVARAALVLDAERGAEERQDGFAGDGRKPVDKGCKINGSHAAMYAPFFFGCHVPTKRGIHESRVCGGYRKARSQPCREAAGMTTESEDAPSRGVSAAVGDRHRGRGDARPALHRQPVPAQFGRRDRAQPRRRGRADADPDRAAVQHLFSGVRGGAIAARRRARPFRSEALHADHRSASPCWAASCSGWRTRPVASSPRARMLGFGTASFLMAPIALYARWFPPERFSTFAGIQLGLGSLGAIFATAPLAYATASFGWRMTFLGVGHMHRRHRHLVWLIVSDDPPGVKNTPRRETLRESVAGIWQVIRTPSMWPRVHGAACDLSELRADRRPLGRAVSDSRLRLRPQGPRRHPVRRGADAGAGLVLLGAERPAVRPLQGSDHHRLQRTASFRWRCWRRSAHCRSGRCCLRSSCSDSRPA